MVPLITCVTTEIGRGHSNYLDSVFIILQEEHRERLRLERFTVFEKSRGISLQGWKSVRSLYMIGGRGGFATKLYNVIRSQRHGFRRDWLVKKLLGSNLRRILRYSGAVCLVDHPLLARILADACRVFYIHGEIAAPEECAVKGIELTLVPLNETRERIMRARVDPERVAVCGLFIEPGLVKSAEQSYTTRLWRIQSHEPLTIGFFTSGAYSPSHMSKIITGVNSVVRSGMRAVVFTGTEERVFDWVKKNIECEETFEDTGDEVHSEHWRIRVVKRITRQAETRRAVELLPLMDVFVAAPHERTNWAVGLGIPLYALFPLIGPFASQNFRFASRQKVCELLRTIGEARNFGEVIMKARESGHLLKMAQNGFGLYSIEGVRRAATEIVKRVL